MTWRYVFYQTYQNPAIFRALYIILSSDIFKLICVLFRHIQPYCGIFKTQRISCIFRTLPCSESLHIQNPRYIQNSIKKHSSIFRRLRNARILKTLPYSELCHIQNLAYSGLEAYSESCLYRYIQTYSGIFKNEAIITLTFFFYTLILDILFNEI